VNEVDLTNSDNKLFLGQYLYSGMVVNRFENNQVKSIYQVNQGLVKGQMTSYWFDSEYKSSDFLDTTEINRLNIQLSNKSNQVEGGIQDSIKSFKEAMDYLNYEVGGKEKLVVLVKKNKEGKLNPKKKEVFDNYEKLVQIQDKALRQLSELRRSITDVNQKILTETKKPSYKGNKSKEFEQINFIAEGKAIIYDSLGNKYGEGVLIKGLENGNWIYWFKSGNKLKVSNYKAGLLVRDTAFYETGEIQSVLIYNSDLRDESFIFYDKIGNKKLVSHKKDGLGIVMVTGYYDNGIKKNVLNFKADSLDGLCTSYYENGNTEEVLNYKEGLFDGLCTSYYENGNKKLVRNYHAGLLDGVSIDYDENGKKKKVENYKADILNGLCTSYYKNGNTEIALNYKEGLVDGLSTTHYENGKKKLLENYLSGVLEGLQTSYYENGNTEKAVNYINNEMNGSFKMYHSNGKLWMRGIINPRSLALNRLIGEYFQYTKEGVLELHNKYQMDGTEINLMD